MGNSHSKYRSLCFPVVVVAVTGVAVIRKFCLVGTRGPPTHPRTTLDPTHARDTVSDDDRLRTCPKEDAPDQTVAKRLLLEEKLYQFAVDGTKSEDLFGDRFADVAPCEPTEQQRQTMDLLDYARDHDLKVAVYNVAAFGAYYYSMVVDLQQWPHRLRAAGTDLKQVQRPWVSMLVFQDSFRLLPYPYYLTPRFAVHTNGLGHMAGNLVPYSKHRHTYSTWSFNRARQDVTRHQHYQHLQATLEPWLSLLELVELVGRYCPDSLTTTVLGASDYPLF